MKKYHLHDTVEFSESESEESLICVQPCKPMGYTGQNTGVGSLSLLQGIFRTQPTDRIQVSSIAGGLFTSWATREAQIDKMWIKVLVVEDKKQYIWIKLTILEGLECSRI